MDKKQFDLFMSVAYFAIGFSPITALAMAIFGILPLSVATRFEGLAPRFYSCVFL